jgi:anti-anti-sigma factor
MKSSLHLEETTLTLRLPADLVSTNVGTVREEISALLESPAGQPQPWRMFKLDLSAAKKVDSVGLNLIVAMLKAVQRAGAKMQILCSDPNVHRTMLFTRLDKHVELVKT